MIAENANVIAAAFAIGTAFGASIVLVTIWLMHSLERQGRRFP